jgi:excinuclease UvrABC nuclease subunit
MAATQLWLFPPARPLVERLGPEFFRSVPRQPGVYFFCGPESGVLYIGKAKDLRKRLSSYRVANPERMSRRVIRLLNATTRIEFEICASEEMAIHRESEFISALNPKFNRAGCVWPV